jgi:hypothetical protein
VNDPWVIDPRPPVRRPVKPRKPRTVYKPIIAIDDSKVLLESGEILPYSELPLVIRTQPSSILVAHNFGPIIQFLDREFTDDPLWQFRAAPVERAAWAPNRKRKAVMRDCTIGYLGFKGPNKRKGSYHYPLSPKTFVLKTVGELRRGIPESSANLVKLMEWAKEVRQFLDKHKLNLSPTSGGIAAQLLRDAKFYPEDRRKVPRHTNAIAREQLPGNYYQLYEALEGKGYHKAAYLDQVSAHHTAARELTFPNANTLRRKGRHSTLKDRSFAKIGTAKFDALIKEYGLFYLAFEAPHFSDKDFPLPNVTLKLNARTHYGTGFFYSNEIPYLEEIGVRLRHIIACWTSPDADIGLNLYSEWALKEIAEADPKSKPWLKPTLLSTYGVLASKPKINEFGYKQAENGIEKKYPCGSGFLDVQAKISEKMREPLMANVIHRGMIEAQTRLTSMRLARKLAHEGHTILAIYADSVFVASSELPFLPEPWRIQEFLTGLHFESATHFTSRELSKLPGVSLKGRQFGSLPPRPKSRK